MKLFLKKNVHFTWHNISNILSCEDKINFDRIKILKLKGVSWTFCMNIYMKCIWVHVCVFSRAHWCVLVYVHLFEQGRWKTVSGIIPRHYIFFLFLFGNIASHGSRTSANKLGRLGSGCHGSSLHQLSACSVVSRDFWGSNSVQAPYHFTPESQLQMLTYFVWTLSANCKPNREFISNSLTLQDPRSNCWTYPAVVMFH